MYHEQKKGKPTYLFDHLLSRHSISKVGSRGSLPLSYFRYRILNRIFFMYFLCFLAHFDPFKFENSKFSSRFWFEMFFVIEMICKISLQFKGLAIFCLLRNTMCDLKRKTHHIYVLLILMMLYMILYYIQLHLQVELL